MAAPDLARVKENVAKMASMNAPEADIDGYIASEGATVDQVRAFQPPPSTGADVLKSVGSGIQRGAAGAAVALPNLLNAAAAGPQLLGRGIADTVSDAIGVAKQPRPPVWQPFFSSEDALQALPEPLTPYDPQTAAGKAAEFGTELLAGAATAKGIQKAEPSFTAMMKDAAGTAPKVVPKSAAEIKALAQQSYAAAEQQGGVLKSHVTDNFLNDVATLAPQTPAGKLLAGDSPFGKITERLQGLRGKPLTLREAQEVDEYLGEAVDDFTTLGQVNKQGKKLLDVQTKLRQAIDAAADTDVAGGKAGFDSLKEGRRLWSAAAKQRDVERVIARAEMSDNPATALKSGFRTLAGNDARMRGFTPEERKLVANAAKTGIVTDTLRFLGGRLPALISLGSGGGAAQTAALNGGSMLARDAATRVQMQQANKVLNAISNRAVPPPVRPPASPLSVNPLLYGGVGAGLLFPRQDQ